jgi:hypothetical protein
MGLHMNKKKLLITLSISMLIFAGCTSVQPLYYWGSYENQVYSYFKGEPIEKQIQALEEDLAKAKSKNQNTPPGFFAHLGFLYEKTGNSAKATEMFEKEKIAYPEANIFINNINNNVNHNVNNNVNNNLNKIHEKN